jgi:hypothetical protein
VKVFAVPRKTEYVTAQFAAGVTAAQVSPIALDEEAAAASLVGTAGRAPQTAAAVGGACIEDKSCCLRELGGVAS